ncbi:hypothetical protein A8M60_06825 [Nocardia farcinica]|nr:hypothetical protein A8M60_06825 [Nocardia farcinica]
MGLWDSVKDFGGGRLDGEMSSSGSGARIRAGVRDLPVIGDVNLVDVQVPGFRNGGVIGQSRAQAAQAAAGDQRAKLAALQRRRGGASAPTRRGSPSPAPAADHSHRSGGGGGGRGPAHGIGAGLLLTPGIGMNGPGGHGLPRQKHEIAPGVPCPTCMTGETKPVR